MKQYLLFLFLFSFVCNVAFGQNCVDLSKQKKELEQVIAQIDAKYEDKAKLQDLPNLFKSCVNSAELENIKTTYLSLKFDAPQHKSYKVIIKKILDDNKLLCVNFVKNTQKATKEYPVVKNYIEDLDVLIKEYEGLKEKNKNANTYNGTPTENNYNVLNQLKPLLNDCVVGENLKTIKELNNKIITEGFNGGKTKEFNANLREILELNSELFETKTVVPIQDTTKKLETGTAEEVIDEEKSESNLGTYLFYILLFISIAANVYFLYEKFFNKNTSKKSEDKINKKADSNNGENVLKTQRLESENENLKKENRKVENENENLKKDNKRLQQRITEMEEIKRVPIELSIPVSEDKKQTDKEFNRNNSGQTLFFASPTANGEFLAKNGQSEAKSGASIYVFYITGSEATFKFYNDSSTFQATINDPGNRIKPVCDAENAYNPAATRINTVKEGKATLIGDKWEVKAKAKIRYEG